MVSLLEGKLSLRCSGTLLQILQIGSEFKKMEKCLVKEAPTELSLALTSLSVHSQHDFPIGSFSQELHHPKVFRNFQIGHGLRREET